MGRRNVKRKQITFSEDIIILHEHQDPPMISKDSSAGVGDGSLEDLPGVEHSRVFWRTNTSFSDGEEDDKSNSSGSSTNEERSSILVIDSTSAKAESLRQRNEKLLEVPVEHQKSYTVVETKKKTDVYVEVDLEKYMAAREMTPFQERMNALTMVPPPMFCLFFVLSGGWVSKAILAETMQELQIDKMSFAEATAAFEANELCLDWSNTTWFGWLFENLHAMPPLPLLATVVGVVIHAPWSFLYHWKYAHTLSPTKRTDHWSRRMDQSMLHVSSALASFGTCGFVDFFLVCVIFAADSIYRQFLKEVKPKRNQRNLGLAILAWTIPILKRGDLDLFFKVFVTLAIGLFFFVRYPIGGWSHAAFHVFLLPLMPLLMEVGSTLPVSQGHIREAAQCYALAQHRATFA